MTTSTLQNGSAAALRDNCHGGVITRSVGGCLLLLLLVVATAVGTLASRLFAHFFSQMTFLDWLLMAFVDHKGFFLSQQNNFSDGVVSQVKEEEECIIASNRGGSFVARKMTGLNFVKES